MPSLHPVTFWILCVIAALLLAAPAIFLALGAAGKLSPALKSDLWTRYKSWLFLAPAMLLPVRRGTTADGARDRHPRYSVQPRVCAGHWAFPRADDLAAWWSLGIVLLTFAVADHWYGFFVALNSLVVSLLVIVALFADQPRGYIQRVALGVLAFVLFGVCLGHFAYFANDRLGQPLLLAIVLCVELNDVFAYCTGKIFGRRKLAPKTSPNKTLGGALGALVLTTALFADARALHLPRHARWIIPRISCSWRLLLSLTGQWGDLVMSSIKRDLGIKDMAATIPGHGGLLDRFDSLIFVGPALFHYIGYFQASGWISRRGFSAVGEEFEVGVKLECRRGRSELRSDISLSLSLSTAR